MKRNKVTLRVSDGWTMGTQGITPIEYVQDIISCSSDGSGMVEQTESEVRSLITLVGKLLECLIVDNRMTAKQVNDLVGDGLYYSKEVVKIDVEEIEDDD